MSIKNNIIPHKMRRALFGGLNSAAEAVTPGHPDKTCDQIACKILDEALKSKRKGDDKIRVAIEMVASDGKIYIGGEVSENVKRVLTDDKVKKISQSIFNKLGYSSKIDFKIEVFPNINIQSDDIRKGSGTGVDSDTEKGNTGAGDQGIMCGYAINIPEFEYCPAAFWFAKKLSQKLYNVAIEKREILNLFADGKTQIIIKDGKIDHVTIAIHHDKYWSDKQDDLKKEIYEKVIKPVIGNIDYENCQINGTGKFEKGSIWADAGEVGRKIVIDQMGPDIPVGGGALCGKDPSKVDITAALMARFIAKNIVANNLADEALVQFAFTIGNPMPDIFHIFTKNWILEDLTPYDWCTNHFNISVQEMIDTLCLENPLGWSYEEAAMFGFYGDTKFPWEKIITFK